MRWRTFIGGAAVQASITAALATQAFLAPRILGADEYGRAIGVLALAFLAHVSVETVLFALTIRWTAAGRWPELHRLWADALAAAPLAAILAVALSMVSLAGRSIGERWAFLAGAPLLLTIWIAATILMGCAYALHRHGSIARTYLLSAVVLPGSIFLLRGYGARSFLFGLVIDKVGVLASLLLDGRVRNLCARVAAGEMARWRGRRLFDEYLPVLTPRLTLLLLSPGLVALGAALLVPDQLAGFKVSISFATAAASVVPVSQYVLQAQWTNQPPEQARAVRREAQRVLGGVLLAGFVFAAGLLVYGDALRVIVLRTADASLRRFDVVFFAVPLFVLIGPLSSFLIAHQQARRLLLAFAASVLGVTVMTASAGLSWGFVGGSALFVLCALPAVFSSLDR
jgi:hypothetical protein